MCIRDSYRMDRASTERIRELMDNKDTINDNMEMKQLLPYGQM